MNIYIYGLFDPRNREIIKYVGQTSDLRSRMLNHCRHRVPETSKSKWIESLWSDGLFPGVTVLEQCGEGIANDRESYWCSHFPEGQLVNDRYTICRRWKAPKKSYAIAGESTNGALASAIDHAKRQSVIYALTSSNWKIAKAARKLGVSRPTVYGLMQRLQIKTPDSVEG